MVWIPVALSQSNAAHLKASDNDHSMNVELSDAQTDLLHELLRQGSSEQKKATW